jgi:hypothetical protein
LVLWIQGLLLAWRALYHLSHTPTLFLFALVCFSGRILYFGQDWL